MPILLKKGNLTVKDRGSDKKPYAMVKSSDFAGNSRSYPIPTRADAVDACRLAHLHNRSDVITKIRSRYPDVCNPKKAQTGIQTMPVDTTGYYKRSVDIMNANKSKNWIQRALDISLNNEGIDFEDEEGNKGKATHYLGTTEYDGKLYAYPQVIQDKNGELRYIKDWRSAVTHNRNNKELVDLGTDPNFANYFSSVGYKYKFPEKDYEEAKENYIKRTNIKKKKKSGGSH